MAGVVPFGCGQCRPCRINRRRQWMWRQFLESLTHKENCFVTLTYDDKHLPSDRMLEPRSLQLFLKRLRDKVAPTRIRFFAVGEYGEETKRPHYHLSLFGVSGNTLFNDGVRAKALPEILAESWSRDGEPIGFVHVAEFNEVTAQYVAGYVVKKLEDRTSGFNPAVPEFARMSNRPGIGAAAMAVIARSLYDHNQIERGRDVPNQLRLGSRTIPLGRYLLSRLRGEVGIPDEDQKALRDEKGMERSVELLALFARTEGVSTFKESYLKDVEGRIASAEARALIWKKRSKV